MTSDIIIFIISVILFFGVSAFGFLTISEKRPDFFNRHIKKAGFTALVCEVLLILTAILDISGILDAGGYSGLSAWCAVFGGISFGVPLLIKKVPEKFRSVIRFSVRSVLICAVLELFVFNFNSAHLFGKDYKIIVMNPDKATSENFDVSTGKNISDGLVSLEFTGIDMPVGTLTFEAESDTKAKVDINIDMSDDTYSEYRYSIASAEVIAGNERSRTVPCNFSGNVHKMRFSFTADDGETITLKSITANIPVYFKISFLRFFICLFAALAVYMLTVSPVFKKSYSENSGKVKICAYALTGVLILGTLFLINVYRFTAPDHSLKKDFQMTGGNQMTQEIVDAFEAGQVSLLRQAEPELLALENPYDWNQRINSGVDYAWDHLLYDGKYYSYYGIAPVALLFLPYHLITGYYFPSVWAVWLFGGLGIFFLTKFYLAFISKFFPETRSSVTLLGLLMIQLVTGIWFCFNNPNFYEIAQTSGFACVTAGAFMLISSNVIGDGKIKNWRLMLSSVFLSLGVLCRPTLAVYCVAALLFIYAGFRKKKSLCSNARPTHYLPYFACALLPFAVIGGVQMIYNYARFGSVMDFGIQYSLTINDFTAAEYHTHFVLIGFFNYLLAIPSFSPTFPFMDCSAVHTFSPQGYYFVATASAVGLIWKALPVLSYGYGIKAYRWSENRNKRLYTALLLAVCVAAPFVIIASIWESGYGTRYCVDFAWQILTGALVIAFIIYNRCSLNIQKHLNRLMVLSGAVCLILSFGQLYNWLLSGGISTGHHAMLLSFGRLAEFWR